MLSEIGLEATKLWLQISVSVFKLARSLTSQNRVIFSPTFENSSKSTLSLGLLTKTLLGASALLVGAQEKSEICRRRLESIQELTSHQLAEILPLDTDEKLPLQVRRTMGAKNLARELKNWEELLELCSLVLESATWLLWHHMEQFYLQKKPLVFSGAAPLLGSDEVARLKREAPNHINTAFFKKLNECEQVRMVERCTSMS